MTEWRIGSRVYTTTDDLADKLAAAEQEIARLREDMRHLYAALEHERTLSNTLKLRAGALEELLATVRVLIGSSAAHVAAGAEGCDDCHAVAPIDAALTRAEPASSA